MLGKIKLRHFHGVFWTQFLGAFNDNVFKNALVIIITMKSISLGPLNSKSIVAAAGGIFIFPFFLFSGVAGKMADQMSKRKLIYYIKWAEVLIMILGAIGFLTESYTTLLVTLFLMGLQSAFFGPVKYSILPELLKEKELVRGNAYIEMGTFLAILLGTILGGVGISFEAFGPKLISFFIIFLAVSGVVSSKFIPNTSKGSIASTINLNPFTSTWSLLKVILKNKNIHLSIIGISWFWVIGAVILSILPPFCKETLNGNEQLITLALAIFSIGIGVGAILCERLSLQKVELGLVPIGGFGMSCFLLDLFLLDYSLFGLRDFHHLLSFLNVSGSWRVMVDLFGLAFFGGIFTVPLYSYIQSRSDCSLRSQTIAGNNVYNAFFMVVAALLLMLMFSYGATIPQVFLVLSVSNLIVCGLIFLVIPDFFFRLICYFLANIFYRLEVNNRDHIPEKGACVLIGEVRNVLDWMVIASALPRSGRFVLDYSTGERPIMNTIYRFGPVIAANYNSESKELVVDALRKGELIVILTKKEFDLSKIVGDHVIQIPINMEGTWDMRPQNEIQWSWMNFLKGLFSRVVLNFGRPIYPIKEY